VGSPSNRPRCYRASGSSVAKSAVPIDGSRPPAAARTSTCTDCARTSEHRGNPGNARRNELEHNPAPPGIIRNGATRTRTARGWRSIRGPKPVLVRNGVKTTGPDHQSLKRESLSHPCHEPLITTPDRTSRTHVCQRVTADESASNDTTEEAPGGTFQSPLPGTRSGLFSPRRPDAIMTPSVQEWTCPREVAPK
jgi:hypothetical protein